MTIRLRIPAVLAAVALLVTTAAAAQTPPAAQHTWSHGTLLSVFGGGSFDGSRSGPMAGVGIGWELLPWFGIEGSGAWLDRGAHADAFAADLKALVNLARPHPVVPFVEGGVGLYRSSFDRSLGSIPAFFGRRITDMGPPVSPAHVTFTDPTVVAGGGVSLFVTQHTAIRPEFETTVVMRNSNSYVVNAFVVRFTYHFEDHPITPFRGGRR